MARNHMVICKLCGTQFDIEKKGGAFDGTRYYCKSCARQMRNQRATGIGNNNSINRESWFKKNWKILFGLFFLIGGIGNVGKDGGTALFGIVLGIGFTILHFTPQIIAFRQDRARKQAEAVAIAKEEARKQSELRLIAEELKICKSCGAPTNGTHCQYCGLKLAN